MKNAFLALALLTLPSAAGAEKKPGEAASLDKVEIQGEARPGGRPLAMAKN